MEGFPFQGNVCSQITSINPNILVEGHPTYLLAKKIDELCSFGRAGG
jgi:hypothetical protein